MANFNNFNYAVIPYHRATGASSHYELGKLEDVLQIAFQSEGKRIVPSYFQPGSAEYPARLEFVVGATKAIEGEPLAGALVATLERVGDTEFIYYDKIGVAPPHQDNGVMGKMLYWAAQAGANRGVNIAALRTTMPKAHERYKNKSDISTEVGEYHIHGFGFVDKNAGQEKFPGAGKRFNEIARYIASLPATAVPIEIAA